MLRSTRRGGAWGLDMHVSPDGIHWSKPVRSGACGDRTSMFYNPFRGVWVYGLRSTIRSSVAPATTGENAGFDRRRPLAREPTWWVGADRLDTIRDDLKTPYQLYNLDAVAYENLLLGFSRSGAASRDRAGPTKSASVSAATASTGIAPTAALLPVSERHGDWNWANVQSAGGGCLVVGDLLYFYVSGRAGVKGSPLSSVTTIRDAARDSFASMDAGKPASPDHPPAHLPRPPPVRQHRCAPKGSSAWKSSTRTETSSAVHARQLHDRPRRPPLHAVEWKGLQISPPFRNGRSNSAST
ncbi:MAG: hypothetical protein U0793_13560 [Gemmataceae bacterium]